MLNDFGKLQTFLTVVREKSFSKASVKLGISQPAVTQQIKYIEDYLGIQIVNRKKNGIGLTKDGLSLYNIALKVEKCINSAKKDINKLINKNTTFTFGATYIIGNYILPKFLNNIKDNNKNDLTINVNVSNTPVFDLLDKKIDIALVEKPVEVDDLICQEWVEDEIVIVSNQKIPEISKKEDFEKYNWLSREEESTTRALLKETLIKANYPILKKYNATTKATNPTTIIQTILYASKEGAPTASNVSINAIDSLIKTKALHVSRIENHKMMRKLYIVYRKERSSDVFIERIVNYLLKVKLS